MSVRFRPPAPIFKPKEIEMRIKKGSSKTVKSRNSEERIVHEFHIISEGLVSQIKQVAEGVANVDQKLDRTRLELKAEIEEKTAPIAQAVVRLDGRMNALDGKVTVLDGKVNALDGKVTVLEGKVNALDGKLDRVQQELKSEIQETRQEILAAVKFSYAELDKRLTTLEKEFLDLKHRVEKMESRPVS